MKMMALDWNDVADFFDQSIAMVEQDETHTLASRTKAIEWFSKMADKATENACKIITKNSK